MKANPLTGPRVLFSLLLSLILSLIMSTGAVAAELRVPEPFDVLVVNGEDFGSSLRSTKNVALKTGRNVVVLEYDQIFDAEFGDSHDRIRSAPFALVFEVSADAVLTLTDPQLKSGADAKRYIKSPVIQLRDQQLHDVAVQQVPVREINNMLLADTIATPASAATPASVPSPATAANAVAPSSTGTRASAQNKASAPSPAQATTEQAAPDALQMLHFWWQQASPEQRAAFLQNIR